MSDSEPTSPPPANTPPEDRGFGANGLLTQRLKEAQQAKLATEQVPPQASPADIDDEHLPPELKAKGISSFKELQTTPVSTVKPSDSDENLSGPQTTETPADNIPKHTKLSDLSGTTGKSSNRLWALAQLDKTRRENPTERLQPPDYMIRYPDNRPLTIQTEDNKSIPVILRSAPADETVLALPQPDGSEKYYATSGYNIPKKEDSGRLKEVRLREISSKEAAQIEIARRQSGTEEHDVVIHHLQDLPLDDQSQTVLSAALEKISNKQMAAEIARKTTAQVSPQTGRTSSLTESATNALLNNIATAAILNVVAGSRREQDTPIKIKTIEKPATPFQAKVTTTRAPR